MSDIKVKDIIFSFRHMYIENLKKVNKRLKKHVSIDSKLINDITVYISGNQLKGDTVSVKYKFKNGSLGQLAYDLNDSLNTSSYLTKDAVIKKDEYGAFISDNKGVHVKDEKFSKELEYILKEEFYSKINALYNNGKFGVTFSGFDITISCTDFIVCYNCIGDVIYVFTSEPASMADIMNTTVDIEFDDYHKSNIKSISKIVDRNTGDRNKSYPGEYKIKEKEKAITLSRLKKDELHRLI